MEAGAHPVAGGRPAGSGAPWESRPQCLCASTSLRAWRVRSRLRLTISPHVLRASSHLLSAVEAGVVGGVRHWPGTRHSASCCSALLPHPKPPNARPATTPRLQRTRGIGAEHQQQGERKAGEGDEGRGGEGRQAGRAPPRLCERMGAGHRCRHRRDKQQRLPQVQDLTPTGGGCRRSRHPHSQQGRHKAGGPAPTPRLRAHAPCWAGRMRRWGRGGPRPRPARVGSTGARCGAAASAHA